MRHNDVPEILFVTNATVASTGDATALLPGQIGIFSEATGAAVTVFEEPVYLAVGHDGDGDGITDNIRKSAGRNIQPGNVVYATRQDYVAPVSQIVDVTGIEEVEEGDSFVLKIEATNEQIYNVQGTILYTESYVALATKNVAKTVQDILLSAKLGKNPFFKLEAVKPAEGSTVVEAVLTEVELKALADNPANTVKPFIRVTSVPTKVQQFANVNLDYVTGRQTKLHVTTKGGGKAAEKQALVYEQNSGYDVRELEFQTVGFREGNTGAYRIGAVTCFPKEVEYQSDLKKKYTIFTLAYDHKSRTGSWLQYDKPLATYIVVENTATAVLTALNTLVAKFVANASLLAEDGKKAI